MTSSGKDELDKAHKFLVNAVMIAGGYEAPKATKLVDAAMKLANQQAVQKALRRQADSIGDTIAEFGGQVPLVFQIIDEKLNGYGEDYER